MNAAFVAGLVATVVAVLLTPLVRRMAIAVGAVDAPGGRHVHARVTPRLGGVAIVIAFVAAVVACVATGLFANVVHDWGSLRTFLIGGALIAGAGVVDDFRSLGAKRKLFIQCVAASIVWAGGARIGSVIYLPGIGPIVIGAVLSYLATLVWIVAFINAINLIDGLDGLAGGVVFFATATNIVVAMVTGNVLAAALNAALGGAVLGFLFYNFNPATIFMGDTGSMFLGYALGTAALLSGRQKESTVVSLLVPVIALGVPIADTLLAMVRRVIARRSIFAADRQHIHHRLLDLGLTHRRAVLIVYAWSLLLCAAAVAAALGRDWAVGAAITGAMLTVVGIIRFAGYFEVVLLRRQQRAHLLKGPTDAVRRGLPSLVVQAEMASTPAGVWAALEQLLSAGGFAFAEYAPKEESSTWRWDFAGNGQREGRLVETTFPVRVFPGSGEGLLRMGALLDDAEMPPQFEILLQVVADVVEAALVRIHVKQPGTLIHVVASAHGT